MIKNVILVGAMASLLGACSSMKTVEVMDTPPPGSGVNKETYEYKNKLVTQQIAEMPKCFTKPPEDDSAIYAVGTSATPDLQLSNDIAILNAKTTLADRINGRVRSQTKSFVSKIGSTDADASILNEVQTATKNIIADVDVAGYKVKESEVVVNGTQYRVYVLLEYSDAEASKILMNRLKKDKMLLSKIRSTKAWEELDSSVKEQDIKDDAIVQNTLDIEKNIQ